jgi:hypothetical protein
VASKSVDQPPSEANKGSLVGLHVVMFLLYSIPVLSVLERMVHDDIFREIGNPKNHAGS